jgi:hypothetical protein
MKLIAFLATALFFVSPFVVQASDEMHNVLRPFTSDGCSGFPNSLSFDAKANWLNCCIDHDMAYWKGGASSERLQADRNLRECVSKANSRVVGWTVGSTVGWTMFVGVRIGGYDGLPTGWHWGYGWLFDRGYAPLRADEQAQVTELAKQIPSNDSKIPIIPLVVVRNRDSLTGDHCKDLAIASIEAHLGRSFSATGFKSATRESADGTVMQLSVGVENCAEPFQFQFLLLRPDACTSDMNELLARGRIRLQKANAPVCEPKP